ncbi:MAG: dimethylarginine dimethylaminohydrolase family protein [Planctomycetota bacterium]
MTATDKISRTTERRAAAAGSSPARLARAAFLMGFPFCYSTRVPDNPWMEDLDPEEREPDRGRTHAQFLQLYRYLAAEALVYLLPTPRACGLQDLVFTGSLGAALEHLAERDVVVLSNFTATPRRGETAIGRAFFGSLGYEVHVAPYRFEGDTELKHLHDNVYIGGHGTRSERATYDWMERTFGMEIVKVALTDPYLYHLDCTVFPVTRGDTLVCTEMYREEEIRRIERRTNIIDVSADDCYSGICNSVRLSNTILNASSIHDLKAGGDEYAHERGKNQRLEEIASRFAFEVSYFNLSEFMKAGALLSCMVMHLNRFSYTFRPMN